MMNYQQTHPEHLFDAVECEGFFFISKGLQIPFRFGSNAMARCAGAGAVKLQLADDIEAIKCSGGVVDWLLR